MSVCICVYAHVWKPEEGIRFTGSRAIGVGKYLTQALEMEIRFSVRAVRVLLTAEASPAPSPWNRRIQNGKDETTPRLKASLTPLGLSLW